MKYTYQVSINIAPKRAEEYRYSFGQTRDIKMSVAKTGAKLTIIMGKDYTNLWEGSYAQRLINDGIKRCALTHVMQFNTPLSVKAALVTISENTKIKASFDITESAQPSSLIEGKLYSPISSNLSSNDVLSTIVGEMKKDYGNRTSALYAYLLSKTKAYEAEKFVCLWMAFNGVYNYWGHKAGINNNDKEEMEALLKKYGWGKKLLSRDNRPKVVKKVSLMLNSYQTTLSREIIDSPNMKDLCNEIFKFPEMKLVDNTPYGFFLCDFCYYLRCSMIHANKPLPLFAFENEMEIRVLKSANNLLEEFLDSHLYECFEERD